MAGCVETFFFPGEGGDLYGCLHQTEDRGDPSAAAVIVQPLGHEYENAHRGLRVLAERLARRGMPALRFDLSGVGDSEGDPSTVEPSVWDGDVDRAVRMVRRRTGARDVLLIGLRFGAVLAARAASRRPVEGLVMWHPVEPGAMVEEWVAADAAEASAHGTAPEPGRSLLGWQVTEAWLDSVRSYVCAEDFDEQRTLLIGDAAPDSASQDTEILPAQSGPFWRHDLRDVLVPAEEISAIEAFAEGFLR